MEKCLFCDRELTPGSQEHVFLSALGGRVATNKATCGDCNNAFANEKTGKIDDALAESFKEIRNGLKIWSGRDGAPPTLMKAGSMPNGAEFDLAPGFTPIMRPGRIPHQLSGGSTSHLIARDEADAKRMIDILSKRGASVEIETAAQVQQKVPPVQFSMSFDGSKIWRSVARTAIVGFVVLYGNEQARVFVSKDLRRSVRYGDPAINNFAGWDFTNEWPTLLALEAHVRTPNARKSGFEHSLVFANVEDKLVAYVTLFGGWRFSMVLGPSTKLPMRGLAVNPRSQAPSRFVLNVQVPTSYVPKQPSSFQSEQVQVLAGNRSAFERALRQWSGEAHDDRAVQCAIQLESDLVSAGEDQAARQLVIDAFAKKLAVIEHGGAWETELDSILDEDEECSSSETTA